MKKLLKLLFISLIIFLFCCQKGKNSSEYLRCDSLNKYDTLIQLILNKEYLYMAGPNDTTKLDVILQNEFIGNNKFYKNKFNDIIYSIPQSKIDSVYNGIIKLDFINFSSDSNTVNIKVIYFTPSKWKATTTEFKYFFDSVECKWFLLDSLLKVH